MEKITAICNLSLIPLRREAAHRSEMVSALLWGETFEVLESKENWHHIKCSYDGYEGWINARKLHEVSEDFISKMEEEDKTYVTGMPSFAISEKGDKTLLSPGSRLPGFKDNLFFLGDTKFIFDGEVEIMQNKINANKNDTVLKMADLFINTPYLWGGRSLFGIDCSGLTQVAYMLCGFKLPRDAYQQAELGETVENLGHAKAGDLAFFSDNGTRITHVGILDGKGNIIHASEKVRSDSIDAKGIFNREINQHTLVPTLIKRYF